jgi:peroxiredoxin Q/BCP
MATNTTRGKLEDQANMIQEGEALPGFSAETQDGEEVSSEEIGDAIIYFYPKADTPGCTREACSFRGYIQKFDELDLEVYGVSTDSIEEQKTFAEKNDLNFDLLADPEGKVAEKFGVLQDSGFAERTTFLVKNGEVRKIFRKVDPEEHVEELTEYLR